MCWDYAHGDEYALDVMDVKAHLVMRRKNGPRHGALKCLRKDFGTPDTLYTNCSKRKPRDGDLVGLGTRSFWNGLWERVQCAEVVRIESSGRKYVY